MFPTLRDNPDYTSIVNQRHHERLLGYLDDARAKGATLRGLGSVEETFDDRRIAPTAVLGVDETMDVMHEEIFGPILPVIPYDDIDAAIAQINARARPLSLYYFGNDRVEQERVLARTVVGGVTINDTILHLTMDELPFGGIGPSGMGAYHGVDGFRTFSHARSVYRQARFDISAMLRPPYGKTVDRLLGFKIRR
jgi:coniferyl-aldehyde dehydrogenase